MKKLIIKVNCLVSPDKLEQLRREVERQFYNGDSIAIDNRFSYEVIEADAVEVVESANTE